MIILFYNFGLNESHGKTFDCLADCHQWIANTENLITESIERVDNGHVSTIYKRVSDERTLDELVFNK